MKRNFFTGIIMIIAMTAAGYKAKAQGMAINTDGSTANGSAMLDVSSTSQGILVPRMTNTQMTNILSPATGLLVFQTDGTAGFYYYNGSAWTYVGAVANTTTQGNTFNGANQLVQLNGTGALPAINAANLTNLNATNISSGTLNASYLPAAATTQGNSFNGASQLVQLNASSQLPAVSGANLTALNAGNLTGTLPALSGTNLTNLNASNISSGTLNASRLPATATTQGNTFNGASQLVQLDGTSALPAVSGANLTNLAAGNLTGTLPALSGANLTSLNASNISSGTLNASRLPATATTQGNTFNGASQLVQLDGSSALPAVSGANLTSINASNISSGTLNASRLPATATTQGNTFNGASELVQLNSSSQLPAVSGANLTSLNASNLSSGTVATARLGSGTASAQTVLTGANTWVAPLGQIFSDNFPTPINATTSENFFGLDNGSSTSTYTQRAATMPVACTFDALYVYGLYASGSGSNTVTVTLYKNGSPTALSTSITATTSGTVYKNNDVADAVTIAPGDDVAIGISQSNGCTSCPALQMTVTTHCR